MTKSFNKFKKPCFWPIFGPFPQIFQQLFSTKNMALSCTTLYGFVVPCQNSQKTNDTIPRKCLEEGRNNGQTLFYRTLPANAGAPIKL